MRKRYGLKCSNRRLHGFFLKTKKTNKKEQEKKSSLRLSRNECCAGRSFVMLSLKSKLNSTHAHVRISRLTSSFRFSHQLLSWQRSTCLPEQETWREGPRHFRRQAKYLRSCKGGSQRTASPHQERQERIAEDSLCCSHPLRGKEEIIEGTLTTFRFRISFM